MSWWSTLSSLGSGYWVLKNQIKAVQLGERWFCLIIWGKQRPRLTEASAKTLNAHDKLGCCTACIQESRYHNRNLRSILIQSSFIVKQPASLFRTESCRRWLHTRSHHPSAHHNRDHHPLHLLERTVGCGRQPCMLAANHFVDRLEKIAAYFCFETQSFRKRADIYRPDLPKSSPGGYCRTTPLFMLQVSYHPHLTASPT